MTHPNFLIIPLLTLTSMVVLLSKTNADVISNGLLVDLDANSWSGTGT